MDRDYAAIRDELAQVDQMCIRDRDGIVFRVRNEKRQYATEAKTFDNGAKDTLEYLSGQNYYGTKWLYGSIDDTKAGDDSLVVSGEWTP